jgi:ABC-type multidrug transport system ATPase subunit
VSGGSGSGTTTVIVNLTGVTNAQRITVTLLGVSDGTSMGDLGVQIGMLVGDSNGDGFVNSGDFLQTRNRSGQVTDDTNFRSDVNVDGFINSGDTFIVRSCLGTFLP